jgi:small subunit ribosomal protein S17
MSERGLRKTRIGFVVSDKMEQSVVVEVERTVQHRLYKKFLRKRKRYMAHDQENTYHVGDKVRIIETRPLSKRKRWRVQEKVT